MKALKPNGRSYPLEEMPISHTLKFGKAVHNEEMIIERADGIRIPVMVSSAPIHDVDGKVSFGIVVFDDFIERKKTEKVLVENETRLRAALDASGGAIYDHRVPLDENTYHDDRWAQLLGYRLEELPIYDRFLSWVFEQVHPEDVDGLKRAYYDFIEGKVPGYRVEVRIRHKQGHWIWVQGFSHALERDEKGHVRRVIGVMTDITELKRAEEAVKATNRELSEFAYALTHSLKAPFRAIRNYANFLSEDLSEKLEPEQQKFLDGIKQASLEAYYQFNDLERLYSVQRHPETDERIKMQELLSELQHLFRDASDRKLSIAARWPIVRCERFLIRQILIDSISNGFKFNQSDIKRVEVGWQHAGNNQFEIFVRDNGIGIDPKFHDMIFGIFRRLHINREYPGTGIGLAIVKKATQKLGGTLRVESAVGEGSTFYINLPSSVLEREDSNSTSIFLKYLALRREKF